MIEVCRNLYVGSQHDEETIRAQPGWFFIHACKDPYHRRALGYTGQGAPKTHPEYLIARREGRLILNLVDVDNVNYIPPVIIDAALDAIRDNIGSSKILLHCNQGQSRSPSIAFLYLLKYSNLLPQNDINAALAAFCTLYPPFAPARGMADYVQINWRRYLPVIAAGK